MVGDDSSSLSFLSRISRQWFVFKTLVLQNHPAGRPWGLSTGRGLQRNSAPRFPLPGMRRKFQLEAEHVVRDLWSTMKAPVPCGHPKQARKVHLGSFSCLPRLREAGVALPRHCASQVSSSAPSFYPAAIHSGVSLRITGYLMLRASSDSRSAS